MLAWLGEWLQSIVVVVLLAVVVELVLPSSKMLRYTRLVIGLILLLTMLNPIFQLFQIDFQQKMNASFQQWEQEVSGKQSNTSTLLKITRDAEKLQQQREGAALDVTKTNIEQAILQQLLTSSSAVIKDVTVQLGWTNGREQHPYIESIAIEIAMREEKPVENEVEVIAPIELEPISIPDISLGEPTQDVAPVDDRQDIHPHSDNQVQQNEQFHRQAQEIVQIIAAGWNVKADQIYVQVGS